MKTINELELTGVLVEDPATKGCTAFFAQFPNIVAEGDNDDEAVSNLLQLVKDVFKHQSQQEVQYMQEQHIPNVKIKQMNFATS